MAGTHQREGCGEADLESGARAQKKDRDDQVGHFVIFFILLKILTNIADNLKFLYFFSISKLKPVSQATEIKESNQPTDEEYDFDEDSDPAPGGPRCAVPKTR